MNYSLSVINEMAGAVHKMMSLENADYVDPAEVAKSLGYRIIDVDFDEKENIMGMVFRDHKTQAILISNNVSEDEQRFITAHEIGHVVLHHDFDEDDKDYVEVDFYRDTQDELSAKEIEANFFAASLLIPENTARRVWKKLHDVDDFADFFSVSKRVASQRLISLDLI